MADDSNPPPSRRKRAKSLGGGGGTPRAMAARMKTTMAERWAKCMLILWAMGTVSCLVARDLGDGGGGRESGFADASRDGTEPNPGERAVRLRHCADCHQSNEPSDGLMSGSETRMAGTASEVEAYPSNLTPDYATGIGRRSDSELLRAIRFAVGSDGRRLCAMPAYRDMDDEEALAIVDYLRSLSPVIRAIPPSVCGNPVASGGDASADGDAAASDAASDASDATVDAPPSCEPVLAINEVQTAGAGGSTDEFVEIYNASDCDHVSLAGWEIRYASLTSATDARRWMGVVGDEIGARRFALVTGAGYRGDVPPTGMFTSTVGALAATGGGVGLYDPSGHRVDSVGYGTAATNVCVERVPARAPASGHSIVRTPDGDDTDDNRDDFTLCDSPTPGRANACSPDGGRAAE